MQLALHTRPQTADHIAFVLLLYMLAASYAVLLVESRRTRSSSGNPDQVALNTAETAGKER